MSVDLSFCLFYFLIQNLNSMIFVRKIKNNSLTVQIIFNLQNHPTFHSRGKVGQLIVRESECFFSLSSLL